MKYLYGKDMCPCCLLQDFPFKPAMDQLNTRGIMEKESKLFQTAARTVVSFKSEQIWWEESECEPS